MIWSEGVWKRTERKSEKQNFKQRERGVALPALKRHTTALRGTQLL